MFRENLSFGGYRYAPESINFTLNGKIINVPVGKKSKLQYNAACGKRKEVIDELKRIVRADRKEDNVRFVTYGFFIQGTNQYKFTRQIMARKDNLQDRLAAYKEWKHYIEKNNCVLTDHIITSGQFIPGKESKGKSEEVKEVIDLSRPVMIRFLRDRIA